MCAWSKAGPACTLPVLAYRQTFQLKSVVDWNDTINLSVWMLHCVNGSNGWAQFMRFYLVILSSVHLLRVEEDSRDRHEERFGRWQSYPTTAILGSVKLARRCPALIYAFLHQVAEVFVESVTRAIVAVQATFEIFARCPCRRSESVHFCFFERPTYRF